MAPKNKKSDAEKSAAKAETKKKASKKAAKAAVPAAETPKAVPATAPAEIVKNVPAETGAESVPAAETPKADKKASKKAKKAEKKSKIEKAEKAEKPLKAKKASKAEKAEKTEKAEKAPADEKSEKAPKAEKEAGKSEKKSKKAKKAESTPESVPAPEAVPAAEATESVPAETPASVPAPESVPAKPKKPRKPRKSKAEKSAGAKNEITVERDEDVDKPSRSDVPAARGAGRKLIFCAPSEVLKIFRKRGTKNFNLFEPEEAAAEPVPAPAVRNGNRILKELPKAAPRKIGAVSLDELFGYNPFAKDSVSAEERLIPKKWLRFYKKLVALKASIQSEINEHSQTAFNRDGRDTTGDVSASYSQHTADIDNEAFTRDAALSLLSSKQQELAEINIAIERMKNGTYGICEITGKPIPVERLRDIPFTRYSIEGKLEAEKQRKAAVRRRRANTTTDIAAVTDIENDVPIVFSEDDEADAKKNAGNSEPESEEPTAK